MRKGVRVVTGVGVPGQSQRPVRELEAQRVPALGTPPVTDAVALQHDMLAALLIFGVKGIVADWPELMMWDEMSNH